MGWSLDATQDLGRAVQGLLYLVASTAQFQSLASAANATAALANCHQEADDTADSTAVRPRAVVVTDGYSVDGAQNHSPSSNGELLLSLEFNVSSQYAASPIDARTETLNRAETIKSQMQTLSGTGAGYFSGCTHFCINRMDQEGDVLLFTEVPEVGSEDCQLVGAVVYRVRFFGIP